MQRRERVCVCWGVGYKMYNHFISRNDSALLMHAYVIKVHWQATTVCNSTAQVQHETTGLTSYSSDHRGVCNKGVPLISNNITHDAFTRHATNAALRGVNIQAGSPLYSLLSSRGWIATQLFFCWFETILPPLNLSLLSQACVRVAVLSHLPVHYARVWKQSICFSVPGTQVYPW